jgi:hypothetical protein
MMMMMMMMMYDDDVDEDENFLLFYSLNSTSRDKFPSRYSYKKTAK